MISVCWGSKRDPSNEGGLNGRGRRDYYTRCEERFLGSAEKSARDGNSEVSTLFGRRDQQCESVKFEEVCEHQERHTSEGE